MHKTKQLFILVILLISLTACIKTKIIDDIELIMMLGYDWNASEEKYIGTAVSPRYGSSEETDMRENSEYTAQAKTIQNINSYIQTKAPNPVEIGKILGVLFGEDLVKHGIEDLLLSINEDPNIGRGIHLAIARNSAESLLKNKMITERTLPRFIENLLLNNSKTNVPEMNLHDFNYRYLGQGMDPFLPIIESTATGIELTALGFFKEDKIIHEIGYDQFFVFKVMYEDCKDHTYEFDWQEQDKSIAITSIYSKTKKKWDGRDKVEIDVEITGTLTESKQLGIRSFKEKDKIEKAISDKLKEEGKDLINQFQELEIDPLMIGASAKGEFRDWNSSDWEKRYPEIEIIPDIEFNLEQSNIIQQ
ncbi:Ger(x)C family spore germination protein [Gracilibacillus kekensis]|uniref:Germination protein, Ger(X)C family n=1 Tax=Gracilibacillus kekensis TaxID=1027249 RepID=A0A1M7MRT8_9BACI|nr:Ger(x)C family spore germination protein [Gracilibacillus kekensis]SHM93802.1 germination protein, Ger(x)C family [Gracilibacillus kekensis]